jgi:hypothetical protein
MPASLAATMRVQRQNGKTDAAEYGYMAPVSLDRPCRRTMSDPFKYLAPFAVAAVAVVLVLGLVNMMRGGTGNRSQQLMRWRVILQFVAIVVIMAALYFGTR